MKSTAKASILFLMAVAVISLADSSATADPLDGQILKFQQLPQGYTPVLGAIGPPKPIKYVDSTGVVPGGDYYGHDEGSTLVLDPASGTHTGIAMADDFADKIDGPILHVRWWGSYLNNQGQGDVSSFLIAFESDIPDPDGAHDSQDDNNPNTFSHPGQVLHWETVKEVPGGLTPGMGAYTEKLVVPATVTGGDAIYEYNAELKYDPATFDGAFHQKPDEVYWVKIAALIDSTQQLRWGWHNRDYTTTNTLFGSPVTPPLGEHNHGPWDWDGDGPDADDKDIWHFQDDAVSAVTLLNLDPFIPATDALQQDAYVAQRYVDGLDGPGGITGVASIHQFSKDLAFELYSVPEPSSIAMLAAVSMTALAMLITRRRRKLLCIALALATTASVGTPCFAYLGGFEDVDGYEPFLDDVAKYNAGQYGANAGGGVYVDIPDNTGLWKKLQGPLFPATGTTGSVAYATGHQYRDRTNPSTSDQALVITTNADGWTAGPQEYSYTVDSFDLAGFNPDSTGSETVYISFWSCSQIFGTDEGGGLPANTIGNTVSFLDTADSFGSGVGYVQPGTTTDYAAINVNGTWMRCGS